MSSRTLVIEKPGDLSSIVCFFGIPIIFGVALMVAAITQTDWPILALVGFVVALSPCGIFFLKTDGPEPRTLFMRRINAIAGIVMITAVCEIIGLFLIWLGIVTFPFLFPVNLVFLVGGAILIFLPIAFWKNKDWRSYCKPYDVPSFFSG